MEMFNFDESFISETKNIKQFDIDVTPKGNKVYVKTQDGKWQHKTTVTKKSK